MTSRCPCATRRRISPSTASAERLREAPRTSGMTQKRQANEQPSCTLTKARTRSRRASACTQPIAPTSPATTSGVSSLRRATTTTLPGSPANASPARFAPQPVTYTRPCVRAARAASLRDFATASWVTQHVLTTATSAPPSRSSWPSASSRSRTACASTCETLQPRKRTEKVAIRGIVDTLRALHGRVEQLGVLVLGWVTGSPDDQLLPAMVDRLERRARVDADDPARRHVDALGRVAEVHREHAREDDERLLLAGVPVTASFRAGFVSPHVAAHVRRPHDLAQLCHVTGVLTRLRPTGDPGELTRARDGVAHGTS